MHKFPNSMLFSLVRRSPHSFVWRFNSLRTVDVNLGVMSPQYTPKSSDRLLFLPALSVFSSKEEWTPVAEILSESYLSMRLDWPGFSSDWKELNESFIERCLESDPVSVLDSFLSETIDELLNEDNKLFIVTACGNSASIAARVLRQKFHDSSSKMLVHHIALSPLWKQYLRKSVGEYHPVRMRRRQDISMKFFSIFRKCFGPRSLGIFLSQPCVISRLLRRSLLYPPSEHLINRKKLSILRPGVSWDLHAAVLSCLFEGTQRGENLFTIAKTDEGFDTDDEDDLIFGRGLVSVTKSKKESHNIAIAKGDLHRLPTLILPSDCSDSEDLADLHEIQKSAQAAGGQVHRVPGRLACHEEFPNAVAEAIRKVLEGCM